MRYLAAILAVLGSLNAVPTLADPHPPGFLEHEFNASAAPVTSAGITTFQIFEAECSNVDFGDGRGETDCINGNVRSTLHERTWRQLGETVTYSFDVSIDPGFAYEGWPNGEANGLEPGSWDSKFHLAQWQGPLVHNYLYLLKASTRNGMTFLGQQCQPAEHFGTWVTFSMSIRWTSDERGWIKVSCDDRVIYADEVVATNQAPHCYIDNQCEPEVPKDPDRFQFVVGATMTGQGYNWRENGQRSPFIEIPPEGITVRMRNISATTGGEHYTATDRADVMALQRRLNALGCDVGAADGIVGARTREAVLTCRRFRADAAPEKLTVATVPRFLELYRNAPEVVGALEIAVTETYSASSGSDADVRSVFTGTVSDQGGEPLAVGFSIVAHYVPARLELRRIRLVLHGDVGDQSRSDCPDTFIDRWDDGTGHVALNLRLEDGVYAAADAGCALAQVPQPARAAAEAVLFNFPEIVGSMSESGGLDAVQHDGLRTFLGAIASNELGIGLL